MLKLNLGLREGAVELEVDLNYENRFRQGPFVETIEDVNAPHEAVELFFKIFPDAKLHSLYLDKYIFLKARVVLREDRH